MNKLFTQYFKDAGFKSYRLGLNSKVVDYHDSTIHFKEKGSPFAYGKDEIKPHDNWFGVSVYHPDWLLVKADRVVKLSLQGVSAPLNMNYEKLFESRSVRYILMMKGDKKIHETWTGELPDEKVVRRFCHVSILKMIGWYWTKLKHQL